MRAKAVFKARVVGGLLTNFDRSCFGRAVKTFEGQKVVVTITDQRSLDQNAYLQAGPLPIMGECWGWHVVAGRDIPIRPSTSEMTIAEASYFIDWLIPWALQKFEIELPLPDERVVDGKLVAADGVSA